MEINGTIVTKIFGLIGLTIGCIGIGYACSTNKKMKKLCTKLDTTIDKISSDVDIDIPQRIIDEAVEDAVDKQVNKAVEKSIDKIVCEFRDNVHSSVNKAVNDEYNTISYRISKEVAKQVANIDQRRLQDQVINEAREEIVKKLDSKTDNILEGFNANLTNITKIYNSIAKTVTREDTPKFIAV